MPIIPATPIIPTGAASHTRNAPSGSQSSTEHAATVPLAEADLSENNMITPTASAPAQSPESTPAVASPPPKAAPKSWADLVRSKAPPSSAAAPSSTNGALTNGVNASRATSLSDALRDFDVDSERKICFLEPRGLVNTGNMCYMNSVS